MLTARQKRFVQEYLIDLSATGAAARAGYSARTARQQGHRLLTKVDIQAALKEAIEARGERTQITADEVLEELAALAFANVADYVDWGPNGVALLDKSKLTRKQCAALVEVAETTTKAGGTKRVKIHDKLSALEKLGRHLGVFKDQPEKREDGRQSNFHQEFVDRIEQIASRIRDSRPEGKGPV